MNHVNDHSLNVLAVHADPLERPIVFIVDDDPSMREALELVVRTAGWQATGAASAEEFLAQPRAAVPSCLLVEQHLPGRTGFDLQDLLRDRTDMPIIFMSRHADVATSVRAMKAGALEFLTKPFGNDVLLSAVEDAIDRSRAALRDLARLNELHERYESLTRREREVMGGVVSGRLNKQVAGDLGISEITVKVHRGSAMRKMRAGSFAALVGMAASLRHSAPNSTDRGVPANPAQHPRRYSPPDTPKLAMQTLPLLAASAIWRPRMTAA